MLISVIGWIGTIAYTVYTIPQVLICLKNGNANGISRLFAIAYLFGCVLSLIYSCYHHDVILAVNFGIGTIAWIVIHYYLYFPRKTN